MNQLKKQAKEIEKIKAEYAGRDLVHDEKDWRVQKYHPRHELGRMLNMHHLNELINAINAIDLDISDKNFLDLGCGSGTWLRYLVELGAKPGNCTGIDISEQRIQKAKLKNGAINYLVTNGMDVPFPDGSFHVVMQIVTLSSVTDESIWKNLVNEMKRVNTKDGYIFWFDHKKAFSEKLIGFTEQEVLDLFDEYELVYKSQTDPYFVRKYYRKFPRLTAALSHLYKGKTESVFMVLKRKNNQ